MKYVSLHHHSTFSYQDGYGPVKDHVQRVAEIGMDAMALTEHGNVTSHVSLEKEAREAGIKPIFGLETYCAPENMRDTANRRKWHLTLLAETQEGYRNLMRLVSKSWKDGFYQWPTIHGSWLREYGEGIIALSGCLDSKLACDLLGGKGREFGREEDAIRTIHSFKRIFGDRFYLEVQQFPELQRAHQVNEWYEQASKRFGVPLVATSDCHYPLPDDNKMQVVLHAAGRGIGNVDTAESQWEYDIRLCPPSSDAAILERLRATGLTGPAAEQAVASTAEIAQRCNVQLQRARNLRFPIPREYKDSNELAWEWLRRGWRYRLPRNPNMQANPKAYVDRLKYEMEMIESKDYLDYFLMLSDAVSWAKDKGIPVGPARGSAAASIACYLWRITEIDPLPFPNMLFERFIDVTRTDLPDVDLDFDDERRDELRQHLVELYGADRVGNVGTFTKYKAKNSLDDVARVHGIPSFEVAKVKDLIIERSGADARASETLADTIEAFPQAKEVMDRYPDLWKSVRLEGNYKGMSVHSAGLVISNDPITDTVAYYTQMDKKSGQERQVLSVNKYDAEYLNLLKADFLGLKTMGQVRHSLEMIGMSLEDLYALPLDLPEVIGAFRENDVAGIFQYSGLATRIVNGDVKPDNFDELCDVNALSRPGPLHSGTTNDYVLTKWGNMDPIHWHPVIDEITKSTKFQIIYQEQILRIIKEVGGLPWAAVNTIRKVISQKKGEGEFNKQSGTFIEGAGERYGITPENAAKIWARLVTAGQYAFNSSHCVSYSTLAYWQMWMKVHHPESFYAGCLIKADKDGQYALLRDALSHGIDIKPPDPNKSKASWSVDAGALLGGFAQVPGFAEKMGKKILENREEEGDFKDWKDVARIPGVGPKTVAKVEAMVASDDPYGIKRVDVVLTRVLRAIDNYELVGVPRPRYKANEIGKLRYGANVVFMGIPISRVPHDVVEDERGRTGEDESVIRARMKDPHLTKKMLLVAKDDSPEQSMVRFQRHDFPRFEDALWNHLTLNHDVIIAQGKKSMAYGNSFNVKKLWIIDPDELGESDVS